MVDKMPLLLMVNRPDLAETLAVAKQVKIVRIFLQFQYSTLISIGFMIRNLTCVSGSSPSASLAAFRSHTPPHLEGESQFNLDDFSAFDLQTEDPEAEKRLKRSVNERLRETHADCL